MKYIAYCRKSTDEKDKQLLSIEAQIAELKEYANRSHLDVVDYVSEAKTAKVPGREKFAEVLKRIEYGEAQGILAWHADRLARNSIDGGRVIYLLDTGKLLDLKFPTLWFDNTPQGKFMLSIAFGQSKYYVDNLSENVKRGLRQKLRNGVWPSKAPFGYLNDPKTRTITIDPEISPLIKKSFELFSHGTHSFVDVSRFLYKHGLGNRRSGRPIKIDYVKEMLSNRFYIGIMKYAGEYYDATHPAFISKKLFAAVQKQITKRLKPRQGGHEFSFTGLIKCGECGASITAETHRKIYKRTHRTADYVYYRCTKKIKPCSQRAVTEADLDWQIRTIIARAALPKQWVSDWYQWLQADEKSEAVSRESTINELGMELKLFDEKLNKLLDGYLDGVIDSQTYKQKKNQLFEEKLRKTEELEKLKNDGSSWLEPMREWMESALSCAKIARAKNNGEELASFAKTVGSNFFLTNRRLSADLAEPFAPLCAPPPAQSHLTGISAKSVSVHCFEKIRTYFKTNF